MTHQRLTRRTALASAVAAPFAIGPATASATAAPPSAGAGPRTLRAPRPLRRGDTVAVVAPSGHVTPASQRARVLTGIERMRAWGLDVVEGEHLWDSDPTVGLAGTDEDRAADLLTAWNDPAVDAIITARPTELAGVVYGGAPFELLAIAGNEAAARRFVTLFTLPPKVETPAAVS